MKFLWIFLVSCAGVVYCRPQASEVEIQKQDLFEFHSGALKALLDGQKNRESDKARIEKNTKDILEKIAQVNERQGLKKKVKTNPYRYYFPSMSAPYFPTSQTYPPNYFRAQSDATPRDFKFPREPFSNPILDYVERDNPDASHQDTNKVLWKFSKDAGEDRVEEEVPPGQYIKRKITHYQTVLLPLPINYNYNYGSVPDEFPAPSLHSASNNRNELKKQTIDNVKGIVGGSQIPQMPWLNPDSVNSNYFLRPGRQFPWPFGQYFPIVIRDPMMQLVNAVTNMVEYGPQATLAGPSACSNKGKTAEVDLEQIERGPDSMTPSTVLDIEDIHITTGNVKGQENVDSFSNSREARQFRNSSSGQPFSTHPSKLTKFFNNRPLVQLPQTQQSNQENVNTNNNNKKKETLSPPKREQDEDEEDDKAEDVHVSSDGNKKFFSKDNTGSGIFIKKIKVRRGGVAIAGPGGIATAGSGGTAIVGPNGFAYTQPNSLAIAGSGTKVISVDPSIDLEALVNSTVANKESGNRRGSGHIPRVGRIVAVGPVVYYNQG